MYFHVSINNALPPGMVPPANNPSRWSSRLEDHQAQKLSTDKQNSKPAWPTSDCLKNKNKTNKKPFKIKLQKNPNDQNLGIVTDA